MLAERNPPPSLLDVIIDQMLNQNPDGLAPDDGAGYDDGSGFSPPRTAAAPPLVRHPERPVLSQAVLAGEIASNSDAGAVRNFIEDACAAASAAANEADALKGRMMADSDAPGAVAETMRVIGTFVGLARHFWVVLEAEPPHLHRALHEISERLARAAAAKTGGAAGSGGAAGAVAVGGGAGAAGGAAPSAAAAAAAGAAGGAKAPGTSVGAAAASSSAASPSFDGARHVMIAFYADDIITRTARAWSAVDLSDVPAAAASASAPLDESVVDAVQAIADLPSMPLHGGSAMAEAARNMKLSQMTLPRDELTVKMRESGFFFTVGDFVREFCTAATSVPTLIADLVHPIEPELVY